MSRALPLDIVKLVVVTLTTVRVPATLRLLDKLIDAALIFPILADVANKLVVETEVDAVNRAVAIVVEFKVPVLIFVPTILVVVWLVLNKAPVVSDVVIRPVPDTSSVVDGFNVLIPTLPEDVNPSTSRPDVTCDITNLPCPSLASWCVLISLQ